jgi:hypothetical protein
VDDWGSPICFCTAVGWSIPAVFLATTGEAVLNFKCINNTKEVQLGGLPCCWHAVSWPLGNLVLYVLHAPNRLVFLTYRLNIIH